MSNQPQAKLPDRLKQKTLANLKVGESAYTVPWAMKADLDGNLWLSTHFSANKRPGGTVSMLVARGREGWSCDVSECKDYRWLPETTDATDAAVTWLIT